MSSLNKVILIGNVGKDPELKTFQDGKLMSSFTLATSTYWKDKSSNEMKSQTEWHRIICFSTSLCNLIQKSIRKGSRILVEGSIKYREYVDKANVTKYITEIVLSDFNSKILLLNDKEKKEENEEDQTLSSPKKYFDHKNFDLDDEIPF